MAEIKITCPKCGEEIILSEALTHQLEEKIGVQIRAETIERYENKYKKDVEELQTKMTIEKERLRTQIQEKVSFELLDLQEQLKEKNIALGEKQKQELELRKKQRELEEKQKNLELEIVKKVEVETKKIETRVTEQINQANYLRELEKDKQLSDLKKQIDELKRKAEQGSQQTQGEVAELGLEELLKERFPDDEFEPVSKGVKGGDLIQKVVSKAGKYCGTILWESKNTKNWSDKWLPKLRDDQRSIKADIAILATSVLPDGVTHFSHVENIWVCDFAYTVDLVSALRTGIIDVTYAKLSAIGKDEKIEVLYGYLSGTEFKQRIEGLVESFISLRENLDQEKRAMEQIWAKREKQIYRAVNQVAGMYGDMKGIIGAALPKVDRLELPSPEND
jgi:hypothetical protein